MAIHVTPATEDDLDDLSRLFDGYRVFYRQQPDVAAARTFLNQRLANRDSTILLARTEALEPAGFTQLYPVFSSVRLEPVWILNDLYVDVAHRNLGVASELMAAAAAAARASGVARLVLETEETNRAAQTLYEKLNWSLTTGLRQYEFELS